MRKLWAPWRSKYIYSRKGKRCIFCGVKAAKNLRKRLVVALSRHSFAMLNLYPYNNGHVMVAPYRHVRSLEMLSDAELLDMMKLVNAMKARLDRAIEPQGFNIGVNIGHAAGAGIAGHVHIHIVPRWKGDTNFMPAVADMRVISESLEAMYGLLIKKQPC